MADIHLKPSETLSIHLDSSEHGSNPFTSVEISNEPTSPDPTSPSMSPRSNRSITSGSWVATSTVASLSRASSIRSSKASRPVASSPTNGSSTNSTENGRHRATAIADFCRNPRLNCDGRWSRRSSIPSRSSSSSSATAEPAEETLELVVELAARQLRAGLPVAAGFVRVLLLAHAARPPFVESTARA